MSILCVCVCVCVYLVYIWKWKSLSSVSLWPHGLHSPWNSPGQNTGVGSLSLLQGIFPIQGSNPGLPHYRRILYQLGYDMQIHTYTNTHIHKSIHIPRASFVAQLVKNSMDCIVHGFSESDMTEQLSLVYTCICMYICVCICICVFIFHVCMYVSVSCICLYLCMYVYMYLCLFVYVCIHMHLQACVYMFVFMYVYEYVCVLCMWCVCIYI